MNIPKAMLLKRLALRRKPKAAVIPRGVAKALVAKPTIKLFLIAFRQSVFEKKASYQRKDQLGIGYEKKVLELKDSGTMTRIGASKNMNTVVQ